MRKKVVYLLICSAGMLQAGSQDLSTTVTSAVVPAKAIGLVTSNDVPLAWRLSCTTTDADKYRSVTYSRGGNPVLQIQWQSSWTNKQQDYFTGTIFDGTTPVARLCGILNSVSVWPLVSPTQYTVVTSASRTKNATVTVTGTNGFSDMFILDGRNTVPVDEINYTKMRYLEDYAWNPLVKTITNKTEKLSPRK